MNASINGPDGRFFNTNNMSVTEYIKETQGELKHVSWPTRRQAVAYTAVVVLISVAVAFYLGFFDYFFTQVLEKFVI